MCVPETCDVRIVIAAILEKKLILLFGILGWTDEFRRMNSENAIERLYSKFESVVTPAHMNGQV